MTRVTHNLVQGTDEWRHFRFEHDGASEAAAMLGLSDKVSRTELLDMKCTGTEREFSEWVVKNVLDYGHEVEAMARPIIEEIFHINLYPVTCSIGRRSASCDGLTLDDEFAFEHKQWNEALVASVQKGIVPDTHMPQVQQIMDVTGASKVIFVVSDGTREKMVWTEVSPDPVWQKRIRDGWDQFNEDRRNHVPVVHAEKPEADAVMQLPALSIQTSGAISIISNLDLFGQKLNEYVDALNIEPTDDQGFANADAAVKTLQKAQDALEAAEASALAQAADVDSMRRTVALYKDIARNARLMLEKMVKARKEQIKNEALIKAKDSFDGYVRDLEKETYPISLVVSRPDFIFAAKNKRTLVSLHDALNTALASGKIEVSNSAKQVREKLAWYKESAKGYDFLFPDMQSIIQKPMDDFQMVVNNRIAQHKVDEAKKLEADRARIQAEEERKAKAIIGAERQKVQLEQEAKAQLKVKEERETAEAARLTAMGEIVAAERIGSIAKNYMANVKDKDSVINSAKSELSAFRHKYTGIGSLKGVMAAIDLFFNNQEK